MQPACLDLPIIPGATNRKPLFLLQPRKVRKAITEIKKTPSLLLTVPAHDLPADWPAWIEGVSNWSQLNRQPPSLPWMVGVVDADTIELNELNGADQRAQGGWLVYQPGVDLAGCTGSLRLKGPGHELLLTTENGGLQVLGVGRLMIVLSPTQSALIPWSTGTYTLDLTMSNGDVTRWLEGPVTVRRGGCHGCT